MDDTWTRTLSVTMLEESETLDVATFPEDMSESPGSVDAGGAVDEEEDVVDVEGDVAGGLVLVEDETVLVLAEVVLLSSSSSSSSLADWIGITWTIIRNTDAVLETMFPHG